MRVTSSKEIPPPPPRMPVTFHLDLDEDEALILTHIVGQIGGGAFSKYREVTDLLWAQLEGELTRQDLIAKHTHYAAKKALDERGIHAPVDLTLRV
jgi:hypothetical protein